MAEKTDSGNRSEKKRRNREVMGHWMRILLPKKGKRFQRQRRGEDMSLVSILCLCFYTIFWKRSYAESLTIKTQNMWPPFHTLTLSLLSLSYYRWLVSYCCRCWGWWCLGFQNDLNHGGPTSAVWRLRWQGAYLSPFVHHLQRVEKIVIFFLGVSLYIKTFIIYFFLIW